MEKKRRVLRGLAAILATAFFMAGITSPMVIPEAQASIVCGAGIKYVTTTSGVKIYIKTNCTSGYWSYSLFNKYGNGKSDGCLFYSAYVEVYREKISLSSYIYDGMRASLARCK